MKKIIVFLVALVMAFCQASAQAAGFKYQHIFTTSGVEVAVQISAVTGTLRAVHFGQGTSVNSFVKLFDRNSGCVTGLALTDSTAIAGPISETGYDLTFTNGLCVLQSGGSITVTYQ